MTCVKSAGNGGDVHAGAPYPHKTQHDAATPDFQRVKRQENSLGLYDQGLAIGPSCM